MTKSRRQFAGGRRGFGGGSVNGDDATLNDDGEPEDNDDLFRNGGDEDSSTIVNTLGGGACRTNTVVKFVPRAYFDQTRGADLLRRVAREAVEDLAADGVVYAEIRFAPELHELALEEVVDAVAAGVRAEICTTPVPSRMRSVWAAISTSGENASEPHDSAVQTASKPAFSASTAPFVPTIRSVCTRRRSASGRWRDRVRFVG